VATSNIGSIPFEPRVTLTGHHILCTDNTRESILPARTCGARGTLQQVVVKKKLLPQQHVYQLPKACLDKLGVSGIYAVFYRRPDDYHFRSADQA
jgi:hypothetical protein